MADKYLYQNAGVITEKSGLVASAGAADAGKIPALDAGGKFDNSLLPTGIGAETATVTTSEALSAGDWVNIWNSTGAKVRRADAASAGKEAHGFVLAGASSGASATVYLAGINNVVTGATPGVAYLSDSTPGASTGAAPTTSGHVVQRLGVALSATAIAFEPLMPVVLA